MFGTWVLNMNGGMRKIFLVGIGSMLWAIWLSWNDIALDKKTVLYILYIGNLLGPYWTRMWSVFQKEEECKALQNACRLSETMTIEIFSRHGWRFSNQLSL
jgi:hypothetical protein